MAQTNKNIAHGLKQWIKKYRNKGNAMGELNHTIQLGEELKVRGPGTLGEEGGCMVMGVRITCTENHH